MRVQTAEGTVKIWHGPLGWGVIASPDVAGEIWVHFSAIEETGYRELRVGDRVEFRYRRAHQDGYRYLAEWVRNLQSR